MRMLATGHETGIRWLFRGGYFNKRFSRRLVDEPFGPARPSPWADSLDGGKLGDVGVFRVLDRVQIASFHRPLTLVTWAITFVPDELRFEFVECRQRIDV